VSEYIEGSRAKAVLLDAMAEQNRLLALLAAILSADDANDAVAHRRAINEARAVLHWDEPSDPTKIGGQP
jgi:hypothetical protein